LGRRRTRTWVPGRLAHSLLELRDPFGARPRTRRNGKSAQRGTHHQSCCYSSVHHCAPGGSLADQLTLRSSSRRAMATTAVAAQPRWLRHVISLGTPLIPDQSGSRDQRRHERSHLRPLLAQSCRRGGVSRRSLSAIGLSKRRESALRPPWPAVEPQHVDRIGRALRVHRRRSHAQLGMTFARLRTCPGATAPAYRA
jgi:hypothetical protein